MMLRVASPLEYVVVFLHVDELSAFSQEVRGFLLVVHRVDVAVEVAGCVNLFHRWHISHPRCPVHILAAGIESCWPVEIGRAHV